MSSKSKRLMKRANRVIEATPPPDPIPPLTFRTLISAIQSPQGLKLPLLKSLYFVLVPLSLKQRTLCTNSEGTFDHCGVEVKLEDIQSLIRILFKELDGRFKLLFSALCDVSASKAHKHTDPVEELTLLLRCCMLVLTLADPDVLVEKTRFLLSVLGKLISLVTSGNEKSSVGFQEFASCEYTVASGSTSVSENFVASLCFLDSSDLWRPALCAVLEVFADELLKCELLREYFMLVDSASCTSERLFKCHLVKGDIGSVLEVISVHFILSVHGELAFENFLKRLFWNFGKNFRVPELSLTAALSLLLNPIMLSAPNMLQAHLILLVSDAIDIDMSLKNAGPDLRLMDCYLTAFERSVALYTSHMTSSLMDHHPMGAKCSYANSSMLGRSCQPCFESYIQQVTRDKIYDLVTNSDSIWDSNLCNMFFRTKSDLMTTSIAYINESQRVFDESCKDDIMSVLDSIIHGGFSCDVSDTVLYRKGDTSLQDIYLLASILKLLSSSLFKAIWCLRHSGNLGCPKTLKDASSSEEYDFVLGIIGCFRQFNVLPNQKFLFDMIETHPSIRKTSKWMLLHFSGLLSLSFASGIDFLVKGCISTIMALLNLYVFEEGDIGVLRSLLNSGSQSFSSEFSPDKATKAAVNQKTIKRVASKFQNIQTVHLRKSSLRSFHQTLQSAVAETSENACIMSCTRETTDGIEEETEETCNGEIFLNCILGNSQKSDYDDLADFIVCKRGKDYSSWLKNRERYRKWKCQKMAVLRWEKKKKTWKSMKGKKT